MNFWNIKYSKQRLAILEKAQAQKRHLISLIKAKSVVAECSQSHSRLSQSPNRSLSKSSLKKDHSFASLEMKRTNNILYKKIVNTDKLQSQTAGKPNCKFINITKSLSQNHSTIFKIQKQMKQRQIDEQNTKIFSRLIRTSPTIKRTDWMRQNVQTDKYKQNIHKSKYAMPDYSQEACKLMTCQSSKNYNLKPLSKVAATPHLKYRNLKQSSISSLTNDRMRF